MGRCPKRSASDVAKCASPIWLYQGSRILLTQQATDFRSARSPSLFRTSVVNVKRPMVVWPTRPLALVRGLLLARFQQIPGRSKAKILAMNGRRPRSTAECRMPAWRGRLSRKIYFRPGAFSFPSPLRMRSKIIARPVRLGGAPRERGHHCFLSPVPFG